MSHPRKIVRDAVADQLTGLAATGVNVFAGRRRALAEDELPALRISTPSDRAADPETLHGFVTPESRTVRVEVEVVVAASTAVEDRLDEVCEQVEAALDSDFTLGGTVESIRYVGIDLVDDVAGEREVLVGTLAFEAVHTIEDDEP